jgi:glycerol uptake facilitator-like aquaporin
VLAGGTGTATNPAVPIAPMICFSSTRTRRRIRRLPSR